MSRRESWRCWPSSVTPSGRWPAPPASPLAALDQLLEHEYGQAFRRLDLAVVLRWPPGTLRQLLAPFTRGIMSKPSWYIGAWSTAKRPPKTNLTRNAAIGASSVRAAPTSVPNAIATLQGHPAVFGQWSEVSNSREGNFMEMVAPGAFRDAVRDPSQVRIMFQHGRDPSIGEKPIGPILELREDAKGLWYSVAMLPTSYNYDLAVLLEAGVLGASFRFSVTDEEYDPRPGRSVTNPRGIPERVVTSVILYEAGPVVHGQYTGATSGIKPPPSSTLTLAGNSTAAVAASKPSRRTTSRPSWYLPATPPRRRDDNYLTAKRTPYL